MLEKNATVSKFTNKNLKKLLFINPVLDLFCFGPQGFLYAPSYKLYVVV